MTQNTNTALAWIKTLKDNPTILHPRIERNSEGYWENGDGINYTSRELAEQAAYTSSEHCDCGKCHHCITEDEYNT